MRARIKIDQVIRVLGYIPVLFVLAIIFSALLVFIKDFQSERIVSGNGAQVVLGIFSIFVFTVNVVLLLASYYKCVCTSNLVGVYPPPSGLELSSVPNCSKCGHYKPLRAHHCSACGACVLKMDHHCPWVNNCVGYYNHKFFVQFLVYASFGCLFFIISSIDRIYDLLFLQNDPQFIVLFTTILLLAFGFTLIPFAGFHIHLITLNQTTLEYGSQRPELEVFNKGKRRNFEDVFGTRKLHWFLPIQTLSESGWKYAQYPQGNEDEEIQLRESDSMIHESP